MSDKFSFRGGDTEGVADGDYVLTVAGGHVTGLTPAPTGGSGGGGGGGGDAAWHVVGAAGEPAFENGFSNFGASYSTCAFRKLSSGLVVIRGLVKKGAAGSAVSNLSVFTLPVGYRPGLNGMRASYCEPNPGGGLSRIDIFSTGAVRITSGTTGFTSLDVPGFYAEG